MVSAMEVGKFFAVGSGGAVTYSTDGVNWTTRMVEKYHLEWCLPRSITFQHFIKTI